MALTRENVESELVSRQQSRMEAVGMDITHEGSNTDLNAVIGYAIRQMGGSVATFGAVADSDLTFLASEDYDQLLDIAEYRLLQNIKGRWGKVDIRAGQLGENLSQFTKDIDVDLESKFKALQSMYGFGMASIEAGAIHLNFAEPAEDENA